ncbi:unnamed protein product, partial [Discosporangium mesarthrocarpum]
MELCEHGDAEGLIRAQPNGLLSVPETLSCLFQMFFCLYTARAQLCLRHYDIKLLNFLVADAFKLVPMGSGDGGYGASAAGVEAAAAGAGNVCLGYGLGEEVVELVMPRDRAFLVKLADFGTSDVSPLTLGANVGPGHFTTLENTPVEYLCCGSKARQAYSGDTFALALAAVHLLTGEAPYEELLEEVECPTELYEVLAEVWSRHSQYEVICDIVQAPSVGGDEDEEEEGDDPTLFDTFYRYLVLFGVPSQESIVAGFGEDNPVWKAVGPLLWRPRPRGTGGRSKRQRGADRFRRKLDKDRA